MINGAVWRSGLRLVPTKTAIIYGAVPLDHWTGSLFVPFGAVLQSFSMGVPATSLTSSQRSFTLSPGLNLPASSFALSARAA